MRRHSVGNWKVIGSRYAALVKWSFVCVLEAIFASKFYFLVAAHRDRSSSQFTQTNAADSDKRRCIHCHRTARAFPILNQRCASFENSDFRSFVDNNILPPPKIISLLLLEWFSFRLQFHHYFARVGLGPCPPKWNEYGQCWVNRTQMRKQMNDNSLKNKMRHIRRHRCYYGRHLYVLHYFHITKRKNNIELSMRRRHSRMPMPMLFHSSTCRKHGGGKAQWNVKYSVMRFFRVHLGKIVKNFFFFFSQFGVWAFFYWHHFLGP